MNRINPFDMLRNQGIGNASNIETPKKPEQKGENETQNTQGIGNIQQTDETEMVDTSALADDSEAFDMSGFYSENIGEEVSAPENADKPDNNAGQNQNNDKEKEEAMASVNELVNNFFDKRHEE